MNRIIGMISILLCLTHCQTPVETNSSNNEGDRSWLPNWTPLINALEPTKDTPKTPEPLALWPICTKMTNAHERSSNSLSISK